VSPRQITLKALKRVVINGASLSDVLPPLLAPLAPRDRAFAQALAFATLRWHHRLEALTGRLLSKPMRDKDRDVGLVIEMGLCELLYLRTPDYAAIQETAGLAKSLGKPWATGVVNAVLRRVQREGVPCWPIWIGTRPCVCPCRTGCWGRSRRPGPRTGRRWARPSTPRPP